jgi:hypothetical protein
MQHTKEILESAIRYNKATENSSPVDQAKALNEFRASLSQFVLGVLDEQKKHKRVLAKAVYK